jgi:putative ATP-binding cassette transporter
MKLVRLVLRSSPFPFILAVAAGLTTGLSGAAFVSLVNTALNGPSNPSGRLFWQFVGCILAAVVSEAGGAILSARIANSAVLKLRLQLSRRIIETPLRRLEEIGGPRLLGCLTEDINMIAGALPFMLVVFVHLVTISVCLMYLASLSYRAFLGVFGTIIVGVMVFKLLETMAVRSLRAARRELDSLMAHFRSLTEGIKELKLHRQRREAFFSRHLSQTAESFRRYSNVASARYSLGTVWGHLIFFLMIGMILFGLPRFANVGHQLLTGYVVVITYIVGMLRAVLGTMPGLGRATVSLRNVESLGLLLATESHSEVLPQSYRNLDWDRLELDGVTHWYAHDGSEHPFTLGPISTTFKKGELVFLVGGNGSGKTTLGKLLVGLYNPEDGRILLDGSPASAESYGELFSVVFSDFFLFDDLIGAPADLLDGAATEYLTLLQLHHKVRVKDGFLSTTKLSQGQRKRLALLSAFLLDRSFYVFDEWAADQDPMFKEVFYHELLPALRQKGKTVLVITHDDKYFGVADRVIKLDYGLIVSDTRTATQAVVAQP